MCWRVQMAGPVVMAADIKGAHAGIHRSLCLIPLLRHSSPVHRQEFLLPCSPHRLCHKLRM